MKAFICNSMFLNCMFITTAQSQGVVNAQLLCACVFWSLHTFCSIGKANVQNLNWR